MFVPEVLGLGVGTVNVILENGYLIGFLLVLLVLKLIVTSLSIGFGLFGGVFSPALFIGAAAGGFVAKLIALAGFAQRATIACRCRNGRGGSGGCRRAHCSGANCP